MTARRRDPQTPEDADHLTDARRAVNDAALAVEELDRRLVRLELAR